MLANLLADYHAVFWLAHSFDLARQFSSIPRRVSAIDTNVGRTQGDALKYRIFSKWVVETREQLNGVALRCALLRGPVARCYAGVGVVRDSDPAAELAETEIKLGALLPALTG